MKNLSLLEQLLVVVMKIQIQVTGTTEVVQTQILSRVILLGLLTMEEDLHQTLAAAQREEMKDQLVILITMKDFKKIRHGLICWDKLSGVKPIHGNSSWVI